MTLPSFECYGEYSSDNYGAHALRFDVGALAVWFSYKTPVAFMGNGQRVVRENSWGPTTGKHLNWIDGGDAEAKRARLPGSEFERLLSAAVEGVPDAD